MHMIELGKQVVSAEGRALMLLAKQLGDSFDRAVGLLAGCQGHVITSGVGTTGIIARRFAHLLCNVGCPALFLHSGDSLHGSSGAVKAEDVLFLISKTGETQETCELARIVSERGASTIALTSMPESTLARLSRIALIVDTPPEIDPYQGLMAVGSSLVMGSLCDALVICVLETKGTPREWFVSGHPGGIIHHLSQDQ